MLYIVFEGPEGSGKSTQINLLKKYLNDRGHQTIKIREPGETKKGNLIRDILLNNEGFELTPKMEFLLFSADRTQLWDAIIKPGLEKNNIVLSDRSWISSWAYQGGARGVPDEDILEITKFAIGEKMMYPDLTIYIDIDYDSGIGRKKNQKEMNRLDKEKRSFHEKVRSKYLDILEKHDTNWLKLDGTKPINEIQTEIRNKINSLLN